MSKTIKTKPRKRAKPLAGVSAVSLRSRVRKKRKHRAELPAIVRNFWSYHATNPHVFRLFERFTREVIHTGGKCSALTIIHRIRWEALITTKSMDGFKINNNHAAGYVRLYVRQHPKDAGFFRFRGCAFDADPALRFEQS